MEKCEDDGTDSWDPIPGVVQGTSHPVRGLKEGKRYRFRVRPENVHGIGKPLISKTIVAKNPFGSYFL